MSTLEDRQLAMKESLILKGTTEHEALVNNCVRQLDKMLDSYHSLVVEYSKVCIEIQESYEEVLFKYEREIRTLQQLLRKVV